MSSTHDTTQDFYSTLHVIHTTNSTFNFILNCTVNCTVLQHCIYILLLCTAVPYLQYYLLLITRVFNVLFIIYTCIIYYVLLYSGIVLVLNLAYITVCYRQLLYCLLYITMYSFCTLLLVLPIPVTILYSSYFVVLHTEHVFSAVYYIYLNVTL